MIIVSVLIIGGLKRMTNDGFIQLYTTRDTYVYYMRFQTNIIRYVYEKLYLYRQRCETSTTTSNNCYYFDNL